ncbi:hypothetical protein RHS01_09527 [Rhizoctonia solani]|uniref:Uncharacterized protein n=1 Tax=Rhizoctonia solani TaxID=456999 RepID=A0A8H7I5A1_9AGAM|nr:hypothetical protein RHS01_09527 [Rhizoctonia solani]
MENYGLKPRQLRTLILYGMAPAPIERGSRGTSHRNGRWIVWCILLITLPPQIAAPILTGSITWVSGYHPAQRLSDVSIPTSLVGKTSRWPIWSSRVNLHHREWTAEYASTRVFLTWERETSDIVLKRFVPEFSVLDVGVVVTNITIPYFRVQSVEWIDHPESVLAISPIRSYKDLCLIITMASEKCPLSTLGSIALVPDTVWSNQTLKSSKVSERRLMWQYVASASPTKNRTYCSQEWGTHLVVNFELSPNRSIYQEGTNYFRLAWVTFTAGVGICRNCRLSSYATVQNDTTLELSEDLLTGEALRFMATVSTMVLEQRMEDMSHAWKSIDDCVAATLARTYSAAWIGLTDHLAAATLGFPQHNTTYAVSPLASQAQVNLLRVYVWLGLQSLITLSGILFVMIQLKTGSPAIADTTLTAFYLDSSAVSETDRPQSTARKVEYENELLKVKIE